MVCVIAWLAALACVPGGVLWALTPLGIRIAEERLPEGNDRFWQLFPSAPLLLLVGLAGLWFLRYVGSGWLGRMGVVGAFIGLVLVISGNVGQFWLDLDDTFAVLAPAYRTFRMGLVLLAVGAVVFGAAAVRDRALPFWAVLPFVVASICGLIAFLRDLGAPGAGLWAAFGAGWVWLGFSVVLVRLMTRSRKREA